MSAERWEDSAGRQPPVEWDQLKRIQDENPTPRVAGGVVLAIFLFGLSVFCFFLGFYFALDPEENIEPGKYFFVVAVALALLAGWAGFMFVLRPPARGSGK
jgi:peptidoglycan/LPS O-acetylase OafA/YrhL